MFGIFKKTFKGLKKTRKKIANAFSALSKKSYLDDNDIEKLEESLIEADITYDIVEEIVENLKQKDSSDKGWVERTKEVVLSRITTENNLNEIKKTIMLVGINGSGKTTSAAKLAQYFIEAKENVCLVAAATYRAAAVEQIKVWANKVGVRLVQNPNTSDSAAIAFDGVQSGIAQDERVIIDTAGRLHTSVNLMRELEKIYNVIGKLTSDITTLMVVDGNIGKNSLSQIEHFNQYLSIDGIIITKLDGTAKGGIVLTAMSKHNIPVYFIGVGEGMNDLIPFDKESYINSILGIDE